MCRVSYRQRKDGGGPHLLVNIAIRWAPSEDFVVTSHAVHGGLRIDREETESVHLGQLVGDDARLLRWGAVGPGEGDELTRTELGEKVSDIWE